MSYSDIGRADQERVHEREAVARYKRTSSFTVTVRSDERSFHANTNAVYMYIWPMWLNAEVSKQISCSTISS